VRTPAAEPGMRQTIVDLPDELVENAAKMCPSRTEVVV